MFTALKPGADVTKTEKAITIGSIVSIVLSAVVIVITDYVGKNTPIEVRYEGPATIIRYLKGEDVYPC